MENAPQEALRVSHLLPQGSESSSRCAGAAPSNRPRSSSPSSHVLEQETSAESVHPPASTAPWRAPSSASTGRRRRATAGSFELKELTRKHTPKAGGIAETIGVRSAPIFGLWTSRLGLPSCCSNPLCRKAPNATRRAKQMGYHNVQVMSAGISGWLKAKLPTESST